MLSLTRHYKYSPTHPARGGGPGAAGGPYCQNLVRQRRGRRKRGSLAASFCDWVAGHVQGTKEIVAGAVQRGSRLIESSGHSKPAVATYRRAWGEALGRHPKGLKDPALDGVIEEDLLEVAQQSASQGVWASQGRPHARWRTAPYQSVREHVQETYQ